MTTFQALFRKYRVLISVIAVFALFIGVTRAAYLVLRPIPNGKILQSYGLTATPPAPPGTLVWFPYLYGNETHKGVDLPAALGTNVYAVESGTVVDLRETIDNNTGTGFGNFVLIRHAATHYIRQNNGTSVNQMGYIYSIHGHLAKNSVSPVIGDLVNAGQVIAQVDNTGNSTGNHIHLQIDLHQLGDRVLSNLGSEIRSRNPELWLPPYNSTTRATAIGLVTNQTGTPQGGLRICGIQKPAADILNTYVTVHTYNQNDENPDDILVENFGTTDVQPGTYHLYARNQNSPDDCNGTVYKDLGNYTFAAGQTTYIGLYPVYLPDIRANFNGWNSTLVIRNNSSTDTARVVTTFFWSTGSYNVFQQRTDTVAPRATFTFNAPNPAGSYYYGAAMVVASQDVSVVVARYRTSPYASAAYTGITSTGTTVRLPLIQRANWGLYSDLIVMNVGSSSTDATVTFQRLNQSGDICAHTLFSIAPKGSATLNTNNVPCLGTNFVGSARITSSQPLAVISTQWLNDQAASGQLTDYEGFPSSFDPHYLPQLMRNNFNLSNGLALQNPNGSSNAVRIDFYNQTPPLGDCSSNNCPWQYTIPANSMTTLYPMTTVPSPFVGSGVADGGQPFLSIVNFVNTSAGNRNASSYSALGGGTTAAVVPLVLKGYNNWLGRNGWSTGLSIQNTGSGTANVTIYYYLFSGSLSAPKSVTVPAKWVSNIYAPSELPDGFYGSAWISSNQPIAVVASHITSPGSTEDRTMSHNGINR